MLSLYLQVASAMKPVMFDEAPIARQVLIGESIERQKRGVERTLLSDRMTVGTWFNGRQREAVEEVIWVSPEMVSRWLGWMQSRQGWSPEEVQRRWTMARQRFNGKMTFIVRLASFPKLDPLFDEDGPATNAEDLADARGVLSYAGEKKHPKNHFQAQNVRLANVVKDKASEVVDAAWTGFEPLSEVFSGTFASMQPESQDPNLDFGLGSYSGALWLQQCELPKNLYGMSSFDFNVVTAHKTRKAHFSLVHPKPEKPKVFRLKFRA